MKRDFILLALLISWPNKIRFVKKENTFLIKLLLSLKAKTNKDWMLLKISSSDDIRANKLVNPSLSYK